ncbi:MAG: hypothetical protein AAGE76_09410 [Pseudomonadota bacterium]
MPAEGPAGGTPEDTSGFDDFLLLVGRLNYSWSNTESLLIHVLAGLLGTDKEKAVVLFLTLNTTRARVDLVERLSKLDGVPADLRDEVLGLTRRLMQLSPLRNRYNHSIYAFDPAEGHAKTIMMRIADRKTDIKMGQAQEIDEDARAGIRTAIEGLQAINRDMWQFIRTRGFPI